MNLEQILNQGKNLDFTQLNWALVVVVILIAGYTIKGGSEGLIRTIFEMFSVLVAAAAASFAAPYLDNLLKIKAPLFSFLIGYLIFWLALKYVCEALDILSKLPIINELNKITGLFLGFIRGVFVVWILFIIITAFGEMEWGNTVMNMIKESRLLNQLYQKNLLLKLAKFFF